MSSRLEGLLILIISSIAYLLARLADKYFVFIPSTFQFIIGLISGAGIIFGLIKLIFGVD